MNSTTIQDFLNINKYIEVEVSKINAGLQSNINTDRYLRDENGKVIFKPFLQGIFDSLKVWNIVKKYEIKNNMAYYTLNEAVIRWYHRDYLGNSYTKLEEEISKLLTIKPTLVFATIIILLILSLLISKWLFVAYIFLIILTFYWQIVGDFFAITSQNIHQNIPQIIIPPSTPPAP